MNSPPRAPRRPLRVENFAVRRRNNSRRAMNVDHINDVVIQSFAELNQMGPHAPAPPPLLPAWYLAKVNQGQVQIPADKRRNAINLTDIDADEEVDPCWICTGVPAQDTGIQTHEPCRWHTLFLVC